MKKKAKAVRPSFAALAARVRMAVFDFDGVLTDNTVYTDQRGRETVRCWRSDAFGLRRLERLGIRIMVLSTEENPVVRARCRKIAIPCRQGLGDKLAALKQEAKKAGANLSEVAYVGNDINDLSCLRAVGLPVAVRDAYPEAIRAAVVRTERPGGFGAVREICDRIAEVQEARL